MTSTTETPQPFATSPGLEPLRAKRGWIIALGIVYVVAGFIALGSVVMATIATVFVVGIMMLIAGVAEVFHAFQIRHGVGFCSGCCLAPSTSLPAF